MKKFVLIYLLAAATSIHAQPQILWQREGAQDSSRYGGWILALGDQNSDGYADFGVLGYGRIGSTTDIPVLEFFHGGNPPESVPYRTFTSDTAGPLEGGRTIGDMNGDGYIDWIVYYTLCGDIENCLQVRFYLGGPNNNDQPIIVQTTSGFATYQPAGDFNGDGFDDLLFQDWGENYSCIYFGAPFIDTIPDWRKSTYLGIAWPGDFNGDGFSDLFTNAVDGTAEFYSGGTLPDTIPVFEWNTDDIAAAAPVGDVNHDGFTDLANPRRALTRLYFGGPIIMDTLVDAQLNFVCGPDTGPYKVAPIGDINNDGYGDVAEWTYWCSNSPFGTLAIHLGGAIINPVPFWTYAAWTAPLNVPGIESVVGLGDVNGDGINDFAMGGYRDLEYLGLRGKAVVLSGWPESANDPRAVYIPQNLAVSAYPNPFNSSTTIRINTPTGKRMGQITIYNLLGESVMQRDIMALSSELTVRFDGLSDAGGPLSSGIYIVAVRFDDLISSLKLVLIR